ncbi:hypothetical protein I4U23_021616 [Adineta vaga]|nr:hypothetical protein I4U23_021616 [Adineta vaga]
MLFIISYLRNLNLFSSDNTIDPHQNRNSLISTRVYLIVLLITLISLTLTLLLIPQITKITIHYPTLEQFQTFPFDVQCSCSHLSISYGTFLTLEAKFHEICSSDFISNRWMKSIYSENNSTDFYQGDFRSIGSAQFQGLANLCNLSKSNVEYGLSSFYDTSLINSQILFENLLKTTIHAAIEQFNTTILFAFQSQLNLINQLIFGNQLLSGFRSILNIQYLNNGQPKIFANYLFYKNTTYSGNRCVLDYNIGVPSGIYNTTEDEAIFIDSDDITKVLFHIPGFRSGFSLRFNQGKQYIIHQIIELNLFPDQSTNDRHIYYQQIGSRLYIFILLISLLILTIYSSTIKDIHRQTIYNPTEDEYSKLYKIYENDLHCPCSLLSISHEKFLEIEPIFHPICSSEFISTSWIDFLLENEIDYYFSADYLRTNLGTQFNILRTFCEYSKRMSKDALDVFHQNQFVSSKLIPENMFYLQFDILLNQWQMDMINRCYRVIKLFRIINQGNKLMNTFFNYKFQVNNESLGEINIVPVEYSNCSCQFDQTCHIPMSIGMPGDTFYSYSENITNSNFFIGCSTLESLFQATFECLSNRTCIDNILYMITGDINGYELFSNIKLLEEINNEKVETIVNRIMIEKLEMNISFSLYYQFCYPKSCTIERISRRSIFTILLIIISILGGLSTGLKIVFLIVIRLFFQKIWRIFLCSIQNRQASRIEFILLIIFMIIFYLTSFLSVQLTIVQINTPTLFIYENLLKKETPETIQCTCSQISFNYQTFLDIKPYFHEICSSDFISNQWIDFIYRTNNNSTILGQFQFLQSFCQLSQQIINESLIQLLLTSFIDVQLLPLNILNIRIEKFIKEFHLQTSKSFLTTFNLVREITQTNQIISGYSTNWKLDNIDRNLFYTTLFLRSRSYQNCDCGLSSKCTEVLQGMKIGCYPLESFLQTTFQCFYNQQCIDSTKTFHALNYSTSRFHRNLTFESILQELMVENYSFELSYEKYFNQCLPSACTYSYIGKRNLIDIITTLIGLYGGLTIISQWMARFVLEIYKCRIQQIHPDT